MPRRRPTSGTGYFDSSPEPETRIRDRISNAIKDRLGFVAIGLAGVTVASGISAAAYMAQEGSSFSATSLPDTLPACGGPTSYTQGFIGLTAPNTNPSQLRAQVSGELTDLQNKLRAMPPGSALTAINPFSGGDNDAIAQLSPDGSVVLTVGNRWAELGWDKMTVPFKGSSPVLPLGAVACQGPGDDGQPTAQENGATAIVNALYDSANNVIPSDV